MEAHMKKYKGYQIRIESDEDVKNPRKDFDNFGTMVCFHSRYNLGDDHDYQNSTEMWKDIPPQKDIIYLSLYLYDHSGITMSTGPFSCPWDSGMVGIIYVTKEEVRKEWSKKRISKKLLAKVIDNLKSEVRTYDEYLTNNVWGFIIDGPVEPEETRDEHIDSCWGFFGDYEAEYGALSEARSRVDYLFIENLKKEVEEEIKLMPFVTPKALSLTSAQL